MMKLDGEFGRLYGPLVRAVVETGELRTARGKEHRALFNVVLETPVFPNLLAGLNKKFAIAELMAYVAGWDDVAWLTRFNKNIAQFSDDGITFAGAYGPRLAWGWGVTISRLLSDPYTRQAYIPIYQPSDMTSDSKDIPCNTSIQLQIQGGKLCATVYQRSCDLIWGLPYDHFSFATMLHLVAGQLGLETGTITRIVVNAHVYTAQAGYASDKRVDLAMATEEIESWRPAPYKFSDFRDAAIEVRKAIEAGRSMEFKEEGVFLQMALTK